MEQKVMFFFIGGILLGMPFGAMITAYLYFPDCWKTSNCVNDWWKESEDTDISDGAAQRIYDHGYSDAEIKFKQPLYKGSNSYLLEKDEPHQSYTLKNLSPNLFAKGTISGIDQPLIDELLCRANSCDKTNNGAICLQCDYSIVADREQLSDFSCDSWGCTNTIEHRWEDSQELEK
jgi:hypothetical protein